MQCKRCGEEQDDKYKFCKKCGAPLSGETECSSCGEKVEITADFCPYCGAKLSGGTIPAASAQNAVKSFYDGDAKVDVSNRKPLVVGKRGQYIGSMTKAWIATGLFILMFGLMFLNFGSIDGVKYSIIDLIGVAFSEKLPISDLMENIDNPLQIIYCKEIMNFVPFTTRVGLIGETILAFALLLGNLTFAVLFFAEAMFLTVKGKSALKKDITGLGFGIMTAIALFTIFFNGTGGGPLATMITGFSALALNTVYNALVAGKRLTSVKGLVTKCVSLALGITLLFTLNCNHFATKIKVQKSAYDVIRESTVTLKVPIGTLIGGIDMSINGGFEGIFEEMGAPAGTNVTFEEFLAYWLSNGMDMEDKTSLTPPMLYYFGEMSEGYNALGLTLGIFSFIAYFMTSISLAVLLAFLMISLTDFKEKNSFTTHLLSIIGIAFTLVLSIIATATATGIYNEIISKSTVKCVIMAAPIINMVFGAGMFIQHCVLETRKKKSAETRIAQA